MLLVWASRTVRLVSDTLTEDEPEIAMELRAAAQRLRELAGTLLVRDGDL